MQTSLYYMYFFLQDCNSPEDLAQHVGVKNLLMVSSVLYVEHVYIELHIDLFFNGYHCRCSEFMK